MQVGNFSKLSPQEEQILSKLKKEQYAAGARYDSLQVTNFGEGYRGVISTQPIKVLSLSIAERLNHRLHPQVPSD